MQNMQLLLPVMEKLMATGMVGNVQVYNLMNYFMEALGLDSPEHYIINPDSPEFQPPQPPGPDANAMLAEASIQDVQNKHQREMIKLEIYNEEKMGKLQVELEKLKLLAEKQDIDSIQVSAKLSEIIAAMADNAAPPPAAAGTPGNTGFPGQFGQGV